ncbi:hypothetical protein BDV38DRAFT_95588 [Aspergillus pseudotamarii]|uniref:Sensor histidine kinase/response regulator n=1 Tax=Aspergillus pseudotamarii TaxID=132259 RepID=A0A5N6T9N8_ASPPS|nr:uncharacterized protein BDV38DRAFT_95588 [Aspergillus pseudotamarii]KAE8143000.1 hypothetical protein BDV38DRAFT_95588 [Aspergillus pseudotamarii]
MMSARDSSPHLPRRGKRERRSELIREREVHQYLPPHEPSAERASSSDILTNLAQLTALQVGADRAVISICDRKSQYVLAETPSVARYKRELRRDNTAPCDYAMIAFIEDNRDWFMVADLAQGSKFDAYWSTLSRNRSYLAVPVRTSAGVVIGIIELYGRAQHDKIDDEQSRLLQDRAGTVLDYLATLRTMREEHRGERMIKALGAFMEGKSDIDEWVVSSLPGRQHLGFESSRSLDPASSIHFANSQKTLDIPPSHIPQNELGIPLRGRLNSYRSRSPARRTRRESLTSEETYSVLHRASVLIRQALDVDGVAFLDISAFNQERHGFSPKSSSNSRPRSPDMAEEECSAGHVLGCSTVPGHNQNINVSRLLLRNLVQQYGRGGIFHLDEGKLSPLSDECSSDIDGSCSSLEDMASSYYGIDMRQISQAFSEATSITFFPLWDFQQNRWFAGCFAWTKDSRRLFAESTDLTYLAAFNNSVMAEVSRLDLRAADREKADFISSVSHEWRSPLHGILTMLDILQETKVTTVQRSLIDITINCGKTLLDTVNHVLDYAKINSLLGPTAQGRPLENAEAAQGSQFNVPALIDQANMATLVEEVAEALLASQDYMGRNAEALFSATKQTTDRPFRESNIPNSIPRAIFAIVDIECREGWECHVSAGAWRRIVMNLLGNALKFTPSGFIQVKLRHDTVTVGRNHLPAILLQISDSGRGISPDFTFSNLYTPFQQEDSLSPGIGVGLNVVYRIVDSMHGLIDLKSEPNRGTVVSVLLPITPASRPSSPSIPYGDLREKLRGKTISLFPNSSKYGDLKIAPGIFNTMLVSMENMITQWFGLRVLSPRERDHEHPDIFIITEHEYRYGEAEESAVTYSKKSKARRNPKMSFPKIVLCTHAHSWFNEPRDPSEPVVFLQQPVSPKTLASALTSCIEKRTKLHEADDDRVHEPTPATLEDTYQRQLQIAASTSPEATEQNHEVSDKSNSCIHEREPTNNQDTISSNQNNPIRQCKVLLVEDNELNLKILQSTMKKAGFCYESAVNGLEAVQKAESETFQAIIMDLSMPVMDGVTASQKIREYENSNSLRPVTIIALTAVDTPAMKRDAMRSGVDLFLTKPANMNRLKEIISSLAT